MKARDVALSKVMRRSVMTAAGLGLLGGLVVAALAARLSEPDPDTTALALAFVVGLGAAAVPVVLAGVILYRMGEYNRQVQALVNIRPVLGSVPMRFGRWAVDPSLGDHLVQFIVSERPGLIVECGSGSSTILSASCLEQLGTGRVISLDHDPHFAEETRERLREFGLADRASVITAPLVTHRVGTESMSWYGVDPAEIGAAGIDILLVDGPPGRKGERSRYPAVPLLRPYLSPTCIILLDDGNRPDERWVAERWAKELSGTLEYLPSDKGAWLIRPGTAPSPDGT